LGLLFPIHGKIKNVPNQQRAMALYDTVPPLALNTSCCSMGRSLQNPMVGEDGGCGKFIIFVRYKKGTTSYESYH
jgi:hypothetical protein